MIREHERCLFCGAEDPDVDHWRRCNGRQGVVEAADLEPHEPPDLRGLIRAGDPDTCVEAAVAVERHRSALQEAVIRAFADHGTLTDAELEGLEGFRERYAYSTVRKRRTELCQAGVLEIVGERVNTRGRKMHVYALKTEVAS